MYVGVEVGLAITVAQSRVHITETRYSYLSRGVGGLVTNKYNSDEHEGSKYFAVDQLLQLLQTVSGHGKLIVLKRFAHNLSTSQLPNTNKDRMGKKKNIPSDVEAEMAPEKLKQVTDVQTERRNLESQRKRRMKTSSKEDQLDGTGVEKPVDLPVAVGDLKTTKTKLNFKNLRREEKKLEEKLSIKSSASCKSRAVVNLEIMKAELKQLEEEPATHEEKQLSSARLGFEFYNVPCEILARNLLGKILVRRLENGNVLKGKIVETEAYLGGEDKASQSYQNKITPRTAPMYMPPGTIYVYLTYGMYHCFNISSQGHGACIFIRALEPKLGLNTMELLRDMQLRKGTKYKEVSLKTRKLKPYHLCNGPSKLCTALDIDKETFNKTDITVNPDIWIENNHKEHDDASNVVAAPRIGIDSAGPLWAGKFLRYYIFENTSVSQRNFASEKIFIHLNELRKKRNKFLGDGAAVLIRALEPLEGIEEMAALRNSTLASKAKQSCKSFKSRELCNGPSKFCIAFGINRDHSKYSVCSWRGMWIEDNGVEEELKVIKCPRIGIDSAGPEWAKKPLRLYIYGEESVSKRDKKAEANS